MSTDDVADEGVAPERHLEPVTIALGARDGYSGADLTAVGVAYAREEVPGRRTDEVLEVRVHGVGGAAPAENLETPATLQVSGDGKAGFYRAWIPGGVTASTPRREAYEWGKLNTSGVASALWLLLICFAFVNVAQWALPGPENTVRAAWARALLRLLALVLTVAFLATAAFLLVDLLAWQAADPARRDELWSWLQWYAHWRAGARVALALYAVLLVLAVLFGLSRLTTVAYERWNAGTGADDRSDWLLSRSTFWRGELNLVRQRYCHVTAGCALVIGVAGLPHSSWTAPREVVLGVAVAFGVWAVVLTLLPWADRTSHAGSVTRQSTPGRTLHAVARWVAVGAVVVAVVTSTAQFWWPTYTAAPSVPYDGALQVGISFAELAIVLVLSLFVLAVRGRRPDGVMARGFLSTLLALLACCVATIFGASVVLTAANLLGSPQPVLDRSTELVSPKGNALLYVPPTVYAGGTAFLVTLAATILVGLALLAVRWRITTYLRGDGPTRFLRDPRDRTVPATYGGTDSPQEAAVEAVSKTWATSALTDHAATALAVVALPTAVALAAHLGMLVADPQGGPDWLRSAATFGGSATVLVTGVFLNQLRRAVSSASARQRFGFFWDVVTFWPRACHPFAPPCYAERSVPEIVTRVRRLVGDVARDDDGRGVDPAILQQEAERQGPSDGARREPPGPVLLSGYSQGAPIAVAVVAQLPAEVRGHIALLTLASPVRRLYGRAFPTYFGTDQVARLQDSLGGSTPRWRNLVRRSDYIGGWALPAGDDSAAVDDEVFDPPVLWPDHDPTPPPSHLHSDWFPDPQTQRHAAALTRILRRPAGPPDPDRAAATAATGSSHHGAVPSAPPDYVDVFELRWPAPDHHRSEEWLRAGLEGAPRVLRGVILVAHRVVLGFRLGPLDSPAHVLGWRITADEPDVTVLEARARWFDGVIAARRVDETTATLTTSLHYRRAPARVVWTAVGPIHRLVAPYLLARAASTLGVPGHHRAVRVPPG